MRILVAMDKFRGSLSAWEACRAVQNGLAACNTDWVVVSRPMADGGEGTARELMAACGGSWISVDGITGPLPRMKMEGGFAWFPETRTALVEMASVNGLALLDKSLRNPMETTTYGTGQLLRAAADHGAQKILLSVGGSATVDGGVGAAMALGWRFLDEDGASVPFGGVGLSRIRHIDGSRARELPPVEVLCDVDNPLTGDEGAARIFGPQKGATPSMVDVLDAGLINLGKVVSMRLHKTILGVPGGGAAGGLAAGAMAFFDALVVSGIETFMELTDLHKAMRHCDFVITGEGCFDEQSLHGKVVAGICGLAAPAGIPVAVLAGRVEVPPFRYKHFGVVDAIATKPDDLPLELAMRNAATLLTQATVNLARKHLGISSDD